MGASHGKEGILTNNNEVVAEQNKIEYRVVVESCSNRLTERVNEMLIEGWELQGGVSGHTRTSQQSSNWTSHTPMWAQAMIKKH